MKMKMKMITMRALCWKEFHEARWVWYAGAVLFLVWPLMNMAMSYRQMSVHNEYSWDQPNLSIITYMFGAFFGLLIAISRASRDMSDASLEPWRAMPIRTWTFVLVKFVVGLGVLLSVLGTALLLQELLVWALPNPSDYPQNRSTGWVISTLWSNPLHGLTQLFVQTSVYTATFALACWTRRAIPALFLGSSVALLLYFGPILLPALSFMDPLMDSGKNIMYVVSSAEHQMFDESVATMQWQMLGRWYMMRTHPMWLMLSQLVIIIAALGLAVVVTVKQWQLRMGTTQLAWLFAVAGLGLFSIAAVQVGNNLKVDQIIPFTTADGEKQNDAVVFDLIQQDGVGVAITQPWRQWRSEIQLRRFDLSAPQPLGPGLGTGQRGSMVYKKYFAWSPLHPELAYLIEAKGEWIGKRHRKKWRLDRVDLATVRFDDQGRATVLGRIDMSELLPERNLQYSHQSPMVHLLEGELWVTYGTSQPNAPAELRLVRLGLTDPTAPVRIARYDLPGFFGQTVNVEGYRTMMDQQKWPRDDGLDREAYDKIYALVSKPMSSYVRQGNRAVQFSAESGVQVYEPGDDPKHPSVDELASYGPGKVSSGYQLVDELRPSPLERLIDADPLGQLLHEGLLYVLIDSPQSGVVVYDVRLDHPLRKIGYYYAPNEQLRKIIVMDDGHVALIGKNMHVLASMASKLTQR